MARALLNRKELKQIDDAVALFEREKSMFDTFVRGLTANLGENKELAPYIHFIKYRVKDPDHLRDKLKRKAIERKRGGGKPNITAANLFEEVTDLAGVRILHLHTEQMQEINKIIIRILSEHRYQLVEGPTGNCWDAEYEQLFEKIGIPANPRDTMYTSVHYIIEANQESKITAELQVRTLMEEVWGEVSHRVDYPSESMNRACRDQLKVLARLTSGCTRLVDSIFRSDAEGDGV